LTHQPQRSLSGVTLFIRFVTTGDITGRVISHMGPISEKGRTLLTVLV
jgi:hypothetical protein